ncbi:hypothetical protein GQ457_01G049730 [Hibiscus cannabinus]
MMLGSSFGLQVAIASALLGFVLVASAANFNQDIQVTWGDGRVKILENGQLLTLSLDKSSGSGFQSKNEYLFGKIDMNINVTTYYLRSQGSTWDEIDFEFLGNLSGGFIRMSTADFHTFSLLWNPKRIIFSVDDTPIREFKNLESIGVPFPKSQAMRVYSTLWNADDWATRGGLIKTDWSKAPFTASYRNYKADDACVWSSGKSSCSSNSSWLSQELDIAGQQRLQWVQKNYMIYNYCTDTKRFPQGLPKECTAG